MIVLSSDAYYASNEWLISAVKGDDYSHFWSPADVPRGAHFDRASFHSGFTLDLSRDGAELERLVGPALEVVRQPSSCRLGSRASAEGDRPL